MIERFIRYKTGRVCERERETHTNGVKRTKREIEQDKETKPDRNTKEQIQKRESETNRETQKTAYKRSGRDRD